MATGPSWGGHIGISPTGEAHVTTYSNSGEPGDAGARLSFDISPDGDISGAHATNQNAESGSPAEHDYGYVHAPSIEEYSAMLEGNPDALGSAPCTHPFEV